MANEIAPAAIDRIGQFLGERIREPAPGADPHAVAGLIRPVLASLIAGLSIHEVVQASGIPDEKQARMTAELETYMSFLMEAMQQGMEGMAAVEYANAKAMILRQNPSFEALVDRLPVEMQQMLRPFLTLLTHDERRDGEFKALRRFIVNMGQMQELARLLEAAAERNRLPLPDGRSFVELYPVLVRGVNDANRAQYDAVVGRCADEVMPFLRGLAPHRVRPAPGQAAVNFLARTTRTITQHVQGFANNPGPAIDALGNAAGQMTGQIETLDRRIVVAGRYTFTPERVAEDWAFLAVTGFLGRLKWAMSCPDGHPIGFWAALFGTPPAANNGGAPPAP